MKTKMLTLTFALLTSAAFAGPCPKPNEYASSAFQIIEGTKPGDFDGYLREYTVARSALNENCEDMYMVALRKRNEVVRQHLEKIGYGPKKADELNQYRTYYSSYISYAYSYASYSVIRELKARGGSDANALYYAASFNTIDVIDAVVAEMKLTLDGATLVNAVRSNKKNVIEQLIRRGADTNHESLMSTAVARVAKTPEDKDILELLIRAGASINSATLMAQAASSLKLETLEFLIRAGGPINTFVLDGAIKAKKLEAVKLLVKAGTRLDERLEKGKTLLMSAVGAGDTQIVDYLISLGLDIFAVDSEGNTAFTYTNDVNMMKFLTQKGLRINQANREGFAPLHVAIKRGDNYALLALVTSGADVDEPTVLGHYPIHLAFDSEKSCGNPAATVQVLIDNGVNVNQKNKEGYTPLMRAAMIRGCGDSDKRAGNSIIKMLLLKRADRRGTVKVYRDRMSAYDLYVNYNNSDEEIRKLLAP